MSGIWKLYKKPSNSEQGEVVEGLRSIDEVRYYTGNEHYDADSTRSLGFNLKMASYYGFGLWSYYYCTKNGLRAQRWLSTFILTMVPAGYLLVRHGNDTLLGNQRRLSLEERLEYYPATRRALVRAVEDVFNEPKSA